MQIRPGVGSGGAERDEAGYIPSGTIRDISCLLIQMSLPLRPSLLAGAIHLVSVYSANSAIARPLHRSISAVILSADARSLLERGKDYNRAADLLQRAVRLRPRDGRLHSLLGCAYADRATSMSYALVYLDMLAQQTAEYPKDLADWQAAQKDPKSDQYGDIAPIRPHQRPFPTKDDGKAIGLTNAQVCSKAVGLSKLAQVEWSKGVRLSRTRTERGEAEEIFGWGMLLLRRSQEYPPGHLYMPSLVLVAPGAMQPVTHLKAAVGLATTTGSAIFFSKLYAGTNCNSALNESRKIGIQAF